MGAVGSQRENQRFQRVDERKRGQRQVTLAGVFHLLGIGEVFGTTQEESHRFREGYRGLISKAI